MKSVLYLFVFCALSTQCRSATEPIDNAETTTYSPSAEVDVDDSVDSLLVQPETPVEMMDQGLKSDSSTTYDAPQCKCGKSGASAHPIHGRDDLDALVEPLVIGGTRAGKNEFPWMVGLLKKKPYGFTPTTGRIVCGGSVINSRFVLTAAHCIHNEFTHRYDLLFLGYNTTNVAEDKTSIKLKVKRFIAHPQWDAKTVANDIGLIELATPLNLSQDGIIPVCLPSSSDGDFSNQNATVAGWGYTRPKGAMAHILQKVTVPVISHEKCTQTRYGNIVTPGMLCAGYQEGGKDACTNDSGGPLTVVQNGVHKLIGIVSWGHGCAQPLLPGVYTRVTRYLDWISSVVSKTQQCKA